MHDLDSSPVDWAIDHPSVAKIFDELGIDYSCPGKSLAGQCERLGLDPAEVLRRLREAAISGPAEQGDAGSEAT